MYPVPSGSAQHLERSQNPGAAQPRGKSVVESGRPRCGLDLQRPLRIGERAVARPGNRALVEPFFADEQTTGPLGSAQPLLSRSSVEIAPQLVDINWDRTDRLGRVEQYRSPAALQRRGINHPPRHPRDVRARHQPGIAGDLVRDALERRDAHPDALPPPGLAEWRQQSRMLLIGRQNLVARPKIEAG